MKGLNNYCNVNNANNINIEDLRQYFISGVRIPIPNDGICPIMTAINNDYDESVLKLLSDFPESFENIDKTRINGEIKSLQKELTFPVNGKDEIERLERIIGYLKKFVNK